MRIKINFQRLDPKHIEGRKIILNVEKLDVELGEILCTLVAISNDDIAKGAIDIKPVKIEYGPARPIDGYNAPNDEEEAIQMLMEAFANQSSRGNFIKFDTGS